MRMRWVDDGSGPRARGRATVVPLVVPLAIVVAIVLGGGRSAAGPPETDGTLDVGRVLRLAAEGSRSAVLAAADRQAAAAALERARAAWWPSVTFQAMYTVRDNPVEAEAGPFRFPMNQQSNGQYDLRARQVLWDGGKRSLAVRAAARGEEVVLAAGRADVQQAQLAALDAFLAAVDLGGRGRVLAGRLAALRAHLAVVEDLLAQGLAARNDLLETQVRVREVEDAVQAVASRRLIALQDLNRRLGRAPQTPAVLPDSLPPPPPLPGDRAALADSAARRNPALAAATSRLAAGETFADLARRAWTPNLFVAASHSWLENETLVHPHVNALMAGVSWDIFDGGARGADVQAAEARVAAAARDRLEMERAVAIAVEAAWRDWEQARREEGTARANVAASLENLRIVEDQYRAGLARSSDVLDAEALLAASRFSAVTRHNAIYRAQAALLAAAGWDLAEFHAAKGDVHGER